MQNNGNIITWKPIGENKNVMKE